MLQNNSKYPISNVLSNVQRLKKKNLDLAVGFFCMTGSNKILD